MGGGEKEADPSLLIRETAKATLQVMDARSGPDEDLGMYLLRLSPSIHM